LGDAGERAGSESGMRNQFCAGDRTLPPDKVENQTFILRELNTLGHFLALRLIL
jgi:hypothetical protein